jgi:hypothetical protein
MARMRTIPILVVVGLLTAACGGLNDEGTGSGDGSGSGGGIEHPTGATDLILRIGLEDGFVPVEVNLTRLPGVSLYGDGTLVSEGPVIEIYPGPALPNLLAQRLTEEGIQAILEAAKEAGLTDGDASYPYACVTDMPTTVFTTTADGHTSVVSAYALGFADGSCPDVDTEARAKLTDFQAKLGDLSWLPEGSVGAQEPFAFDELRIYVSPYQGDPEMPQEAVAWPLDPALDAFGEPDATLADTRCGTVSGTDLETLRPLAEGANQLTPWSSGGEKHRLLFRPLLPDESGC